MFREGGNSGFFQVVAKSGYILFYQLESKEKHFSNFKIQRVKDLLQPPSDAHANEYNYVCIIRQTTLVPH